MNYRPEFSIAPCRAGGLLRAVRDVPGRSCLQAQRPLRYSPQRRCAVVCIDAAAVSRLGWVRAGPRAPGGPPLRDRVGDANGACLAVVLGLAEQVRREEVRLRAIVGYQRISLGPAIMSFPPLPRPVSWPGDVDFSRYDDDVHRRDDSVPKARAVFPTRCRPESGDADLACGGEQERLMLPSFLGGVVIAMSRTPASLRARSS